MGVGFYLCFPADSSVVTPQGVKRMSELRLGDKVRVVNPNGSVQWSDVCAWAHREPTKVAKYLKLTTSNTGRQITMSPEHLVAVAKQGKIDYVQAGTVRPGDRLLACDTAAQTGATPVWQETVHRIDLVESLGVYAPVTLTGTISVDGVAASCYAGTHSHTAAHAALKPVRHSWVHHPERAAGHHTGVRVPGAHSYIDHLAHAALKA